VFISCCYREEFISNNLTKYNILLHEPNNKRKSEVDHYQECLLPDKILMEKCMQGHARSNARVFPKKVQWCVHAEKPGTLQTRTSDGYYQGLIYIKVSKVMSSALAGVGK
jgi:hypothetical protein